LSAKLPTELKHPPHINALLSSTPFQEPSRASLNWSRVIQRLSPELASTLLALLAESPDPDSALILFDRLVNECSAETIHLLERHHTLVHYAVVVFGHSLFLGDTLIQNPDLLQGLLRDRNLNRSFSREDFQQNLARFRSRSFQTDLSLLLARFKRREYVRILLRDAMKIAPLAETTAEISALADVLLEEALREAVGHLRARYSPAQHLDSGGRLTDTPFAILALGKLGGNELNYSSDIDLMFIFGDGTEPHEAPLSNREYFIRLAQEITGILSRPTQEGAVFRIDLRLRPQGGEGELAISLTQALRYYATTAHDWEQQALIKVRHAAGSVSLARQFIREVQAHVYTERVNFAAIKTALVARERMQKGRRRTLAKKTSGASIDVKIDRGGIRDIEFLVQCLQRVYGGSEPWLRASGTLFSLQKLHDNRHISSTEFHELTSAYEFLRHLEHRLQLRQGQQTHHMPPSGPALLILQRAMAGYAPAGPFQQDFAALVQQRMAAVALIYQRIIYQQQNRGQQNAQNADFQLRAGSDSNIADQSNRHILEQLARDAPALYQTATRADLSPATRKNLLRFLTAAFTSSERYAAVLRHAEAVSPALTLLAASDYLTSILVRHPEEIAVMADLGGIPARVGSGYLFESSLGQGRASTDPVFAYLAGSEAAYDEKLGLLRRHFRHRVFAAGARDIAKLRDVYESLGEATSAAEDAIAAAFEIAGAPQGLSILALGRLGSAEFDVLSDADVIFVYQEGEDREWLTKAASQMVQVLSAYTREGMVFPVDTRLRPHGGEGELLVTPTQLAGYFEQEAHAWEALTYTKLRFLAGSHSLGERATGVAKTLFQRFSEDAAFPDAVREMREKLENADAAGRNFKTSPGAVYDIDFLCGFLLVRHGIVDQGGSLRDRLWRCVAHGVLDKPDAAALDHAAELLRTVDHVARLVVGRVCKWLPAAGHARQVTEELSSQILRCGFPGGLEAELDRNCHAVRKIYESVLK